MPILLLIVFLLGFLPTWLIMRARLWALDGGIEALERNRRRAVAAERRADEDSEPVDMKPIFVAIDTPDLDRARGASPSRSRPSPAA